MAASLGILREAGHSSLNETLKQHNGVTFKLVKTGEPLYEMNFDQSPGELIRPDRPGKQGRL